jgi:ubiquinone biosynthesis protein UbiJ
MLANTALAMLNHLLAGESWARDRLKSFAGQAARIEFGTLALALAISPDGLFVAGDRRATASVTITLPADAPLRALTDRPSLFAAARLSGSAELAECLGFIFRNLRWDVESDLAPLIGDIAAHRLVAGGRQLAHWHQRQAANLAANLAEYFTEENPTIARRLDVSDFCLETERLQGVLARLEARVASLERRSP